MEDSSIRNNLQQFYQPIEMPGGWYFNHVETLKLIDLYYNSKYKTGAFDSKGFRKFFFNIVKPACDIAFKFIDLDTKDISLIPVKDGDELKVWFMQRRLKQWLRDSHVGALLNEIGYDYPKYGHVVIKKCKDGWEKVPLQNLRFDTTAKSILESDWLYEVNVMCRADIEAMPWDNKNELLDNPDKDNNYVIYDAYRKTKEGVWEHKVLGGLFRYQKDGKNYSSAETMINNKESYLPSIELFSEEVKKLPYRELKWESVPGRALGMGFVEYLFEDQIATNEAENLERKGLAFKALQLWQTRDDSIGGSNVLVNSQNGDILKADSEVTPIQKDNSDLAAFNSTRTRWTQSVQNKTFSYDSASGNNLPSRTPLGVANMQSSMIASFFDIKRENFGLMLRDWIIEDIIPEFQKDNTKEHTLTFLGSDEEIDKLDKMVTEIIVEKVKYDYAMKTGFYPSLERVEEARQRILSSAKKNKNRYAKIPAFAYQGVSYVVDVNVTGEQIDVSAKSQLLQFAIQTISTTNVLSNPPAKQALFKFLELGGISPVELGLLKEADQAPMMPAVGSMATPGNPSMTMGKATMTM